MKQPQTRVSIGFLVNDDGHILLGLRAPWKTVRPNVWDGIGGRLEHSESTSDALVREVQEEIGVTPTNYEFVKSITLFSKDSGAPYQLNMFIIIGWSGGEPRNISDEHSEIGWFSIEAVRGLANIAFQEQLKDLISALNSSD